MIMSLKSLLLLINAERDIEANNATYYVQNMLKQLSLWDLGVVQHYSRMLSGTSSSTISVFREAAFDRLAHAADTAIVIIL